MKTGKLILALVFLMLFADASMAAKWKAKHVVLIGLDGWGAYSVNKAEMPNVKKLMEEGSYTLKKRSVLPSSSAVNWASMYMGAGPELHGYTEWGSQTPELPSRVVNKHGIFPTVFSLLRESDPKAEIGCICEWAGIRYVVDTLALNYDKNITEKPQNPTTAKCAVEYIKRARPALVNIVFDEPEDISDCRSTVELHHAFLEFISFLDSLAGNNKGSLHFFHGLAAMPFLDTTMIGCDDKDSLIQHTCILNRLNDLADIAVELFQLFIVGRCVMTFSMTDMIGFVENDIIGRIDIFNLR